MAVTGSRLRVGVVGLGVGAEHARAYATDPRCELACLYDLDITRSARLAAELGTRVATSEGEILRDPAIDLLSIASYDADHARQVVAALESGKHVFVEKPACRSGPELLDIKRAWASGGRRHFSSNLVLRKAPLYQWLKGAIEAGELGELYAFDGDYLYGRLHKITEGWRSAEAGYSVMLGGGVHLVDLMIALCGERPARVSATGNGISTRGTPFRSLDFVAANYRFDSGVVGRISANFGCVHKHQHVVRVFGTRATFIYDDAGARLHRTRTADAATQRLDEDPLPSSKGVLIPEFIDAIVGGRDADLTLQRELDVIAACVAADASLAHGDERDIPYV